MSFAPQYGVHFVSETKNLLQKLLFGLFDNVSSNAIFHQIDDKLMPETLQWCCRVSFIFINIRLWIICSGMLTRQDEHEKQSISGRIELRGFGTTFRGRGRPLSSIWRESTFCRKSFVSLTKCTLYCRAKLIFVGAKHCWAKIFLLSALIDHTIQQVQLNNKRFILYVLWHN